MPRSKQFKDALRHIGNVYEFSISGIIEGEKDDTPDTTSPLYDDMIGDVMTVRDVLGGTKAMRKAKERYLTKHPGETNKEYNRRVQRAVLYNATNLTLDGLTGMVFRKDPTLQDVDERFLEDADNIDLQGQELTVFSQRVFENAVADGHTWLHVDMPRVDGAETRSEFQRTGARPYWINVLKQDAINWRYEFRGGVPFLTLFVYREHTIEGKGDFGSDSVTRYRVLRPGTYEVWERRKSQDAKARWVRVEEGRVALPIIPVVFIPSNRTGPFQSAPPLLDLAYENIEHYRVRSDHRYALSFASVPMPVFIGGEPKGNKETGEIEWGPARSLLLESPDAKAEILESSGASLAASRQELMDIEGRMASLGLQMIVKRQRPVAETATARVLDKAESDSALSQAARLLSNGLNEAYWLHSAYGAARSQNGRISVPQDFDVPGEIAVNRDFHSQMLDPQMVQVIADMVGKGQLSQETMWEILVAGEVLPDAFDAELEEERLASTPMEDLMALTQLRRAAQDGAA